MVRYVSQFIFVFFCWLPASQGFAQVRVVHLLCNNRVSPLGLGDTQPRLSWQLEDTGYDIHQSAYELRVKGLGVDWSSGKAFSDASVHVPYSGGQLRAGQRYTWQVRVWDQRGRVSGWSEAAYWEMGMLKPEDWKAQWIGPGFLEDSVQRPSPVFRKSFIVKGRPLRATLFITAHGLYETRLNGLRVTDARLTPGWTEYDRRLSYQAFDVTPLIHRGVNQAGVVLGDGWYRGIFGPWNYSNNYGRDVALLYQLLITYQNGTQDTIVSDGSWQSATGTIRYADLYNGEIQDARMEPTVWIGVRIDSFSKINLMASDWELVHEAQSFPPIRLLKSPRGETILDFGQNLAGWVRFRVHGQAGDTVKLSHAEVLDKDGNFYTGNLREASAQDVYVLSGKGEEEFEPHFTSHGFRFVKIEGYRGEIRPEDFRSVSLSSALPIAGHFHCSDSPVNRLQQNIIWSQQSNFIDVPTDCPQRSERLGWTGDAQLFAATAAFNKRVDNFFEKWLEDLRVDQGADGGMPNVIPDIVDRTLHRSPKGVAGWGDAAVIIPWTLFQIYGDTARLAESYQSMSGWVRYIQAHSPGGLWKGGGYGDWLAPDSTPTDLGYISQCFYFFSASLVAKTAGILGKHKDSLYYTAVMDTVRRAFLREYLTPDARAISNTQTAYVLALYTGILPDEMTNGAMGRLVALIHANQDHLATGFLGTPYLCGVLTKYGHADLAYVLLEQTTPPSWLYPVKMGATTIWEKWQGLMPDGSINVGSFNHYAYGAIGQWLYQDVAGIGPGSPGYQRIIIHPHLGGGLTEADADYLSDYGVIRSGWKVDSGRVRMEVEIPANCRAEIWIPARNIDAVRERSGSLSAIPGMLLLPPREGYVLVEAGSGKYFFTVTQ
jgi:alpha-L-rhamnosidase